jgi:membrane protein YqaA with SNARE-associated domain
MFSMFNADSALWILFSTSFLSSTLLPGGSEAALIATLHLNEHAVWFIVVVATIGNTLGGITNYLLGYLLPDKTSSEKQSHRALGWIKKHGYWTLLLSWLPIIGDPLCLVAGWLRMRFWICLVMILAGKAARYSILTLIVNKIL